MSKVIVDISPSVDGYVAGPAISVDEPLGTGGKRLHRWIGVDAGVPTSQDLRAAERVFDNVGAVVLGRRMFDVGIGLWGEDGAFGRPTFVVTHRPTGELVKGPTTFTFVTDGVQAAITQARAAAGGDRDVLISGGADIVQQCLAAGLVDEVRLHLVPVLLASGTALFHGSPSAHELENIEAVVTSNAVHLTYRVVGATRAAAPPAEGRPARSGASSAVATGGSRPRCGRRRSSQPGSHHVQRPISAMAAGTRNIRTIVASMRIAGQAMPHRSASCDRFATKPTSTG